MMNLDDLIADAVRRKGVKAPRKAAQTKAAIKKTAEEMRASTLERCIPESVHLRTTTQTCQCGAVYEAVNYVPLVKCVGERITHFRPEPDLLEYSGLPVFIETQLINIPYCAACLGAIATFLPPTVVEEPHIFEDQLFDDLYDAIYSTGTENYDDDEVT